MPIHPTVARHRAVVAGLTRAVNNGERPADDPELPEAREKLARAIWSDRVKKLVDAAPPLTREDLEPIAALLNARVVE